MVGIMEGKRLMVGFSKEWVGILVLRIQGICRCWIHRSTADISEWVVVLVTGGAALPWKSIHHLQHRWLIPKKLTVLSLPGLCVIGEADLMLKYINLLTTTLRWILYLLDLHRELFPLDHHHQIINQEFLYQNRG